MKKFLAFALMIGLFSSFFAVGCSNSSSLKLNKNYYFTNIEFMGFSGDRSSIQKYLDSQDSVEEINVFSDYFDMALRAKFLFNTKTSGTLIIPQLIATFETSDAELNNKIDDAKEAGLINSNGDLLVKFDYTKNNNKVIIGKVHTQILSTGDLEFKDAITELVRYLGSDEKNNIKITNEDANVFVIKNGKLDVHLEFEYKRNSDSESPDIATTMRLKLA